MNVRMLPPINVAHQTRVVNGRTYSAAPGTAIDVPDFDAIALEANGWTRYALSGPTSGRPSGTLGMYPAVRGIRYFDTTLGLLIEYDGSAWRGPTGSAV